jgi:hypothetical protein
MASAFAAIQEDFDEELRAIRAVIEAFSDPAKGNPRSRVAAANAATLLLAATFEEFVREMARAYARAVVDACDSVEKLPAKLAATAWKRTMEALARLKLDAKDGISSEALARFNVAYEFCKGDLSKDVYQDLIHNENNMRPSELNSLFKLSGLRDVCAKVSDKGHLLIVLQEAEARVAHGVLLERLEAFFERRNAIAHSLNIMRSSGPDLILRDMDMLSAFGRALSDTLEHLAPAVSESDDAQALPVAELAHESEVLPGRE